MPFSDAQGKDVALEWYRKISPATVVDVGAGSGTYSKLMRAEPEMVEVGVGSFVRTRRTWPDRWTAIEAWPAYFSAFDLNKLYDHTIIDDVRAFGPTDFAADLVIFGDVLEHMTTAEAQGVLSIAKQTAANIIVSIPVLHLDQDAVNGNPYERHIDHWTFEAMRDELGDGLVQTWCGNVLAYFLWKRP